MGGNRPVTELDFSDSGRVQTILLLECSQQLHYLPKSHFVTSKIPPSEAEAIFLKSIILAPAKITFRFTSLLECVRNRLY